MLIAAPWFNGGAAVGEKGAAMGANRVLRQVLRVPLLLALLLAAGAPQLRLFQALTGLEVADMWAPWLQMVGFALAFAAVALAGRRRRHSWGVLALEGLVAATVGLIPPALWAPWIGLGAFASALGATTGSPFVQALALMWLAVVLVTAAQQARGTRQQRGILPEDAQPTSRS
jgi:hypothetical protein